MTERLVRRRAYLPSSELTRLPRYGFSFEEAEDGLVVTYPEGAVRETIDEHEGRYLVVFTHRYQRHEVKEVYSHTGRCYVVMLISAPSR